MNETIELEFRGETLQDYLWQSDDYDYTPDDLTVCFDKKILDHAKQIFTEHPCFFSIDFDARIHSETFEGKLRGDKIKIFPMPHGIYATFNNDWTGTCYELDITAKVHELMGH